MTDTQAIYVVTFDFKGTHAHCVVSGSTDLGDNCIQSFHLGRYIFGYMVGDLVLRRRTRGAIKRDFRKYIRQYLHKWKFGIWLSPF